MSRARSNWGRCLPSTWRGAWGSRILTIGLFLIFAPGAIPQTKPLVQCKRTPIGARAPKLSSPQEAADRLRQKVNFTPWWIYRNTLSIIFTPLKHAGFRGWTDYCSEACALGEVRHAVGGIDGMYTIDLALSAFHVNGTETKLTGPRFVRAELFHFVKKQIHDLPKKGDHARICGKFMWDADGFFEIHPRNPGDIQITRAPDARLSPGDTRPPGP